MYAVKYLLILAFLFMPLKGHAVYELGGNFSYSKQVYGIDRENTHVSRSYAGNLAVYFLSQTGLELSYSQEEDITTENDPIELGWGISINSVQNIVMTHTYGVGLKQALFSLRSFIVPSISLGYAKQIKSGGTDYTIDDNGNVRIITYMKSKVKSDAAFGSFQLKVNLTKSFYISGSVKTVFTAFEFNEMKDNIKYEAGISWIF